MIKRGFKRFLPIIVLVLSLAHLGTIRRDQDPILKAQTDPISLKQKLEETKDGVKGAPSPSFKYYDREDFLTRSPMKTAGEEKVSNPNLENKLESVSEADLPLDVNMPAEREQSETGEKKASEDGDWWLEDSAQGTDEK